MIQNYIHYPIINNDLAGNDRIGNEKGSIYFYTIVSFIEMLLFILALYYFRHLKKTYKALIILLAILLSTISLSNAIFAGGVASGHALWTIIASLILIVYYFKTNFNKSHNA
jgi:hypothetical protein